MHCLLSKYSRQCVPKITHCTCTRVRACVRVRVCVRVRAQERAQVRMHAGMSVVVCECAFSVHLIL